VLVVVRETVASKAVLVTAVDTAGNVATVAVSKWQVDSRGNVLAVAESTIV
jgi:hypothetical protein